MPNGSNLGPLPGVPAGPVQTPGKTPEVRPIRARHHRIHERHAGIIKPPPPKSEINVTPLVDVVLVLLIIFMVVTPMLHRGVAVNLPETKNHSKKQDTGEQIVLSVSKAGIFMDADKIETGKLGATLENELRKKSGRPIHVRADRALRYGDVRKVLEEVHAAGAATVNLETEEFKE
jgi:biopolymer transport protein ExbD